MIPVEEFINALDAYVDEDMQRDIVRRIIGGYRYWDKFRKDSELAPDPVKNIDSVGRSAAIDTMLLGLTGKYAGFEITSKLNSTHNYYYTLIRSPYVVMTISHVNYPRAVPREAKFRSEYATVQTRFIERNDSFEIVPPESCGRVLYAIISHGTVDKSDQYIPGFIYLGFPSQDCKSYISTISLYDKYKDTVQEILQQGTEYIRDMAQPGLIIERYRQET